MCQSEQAHAVYAWLQLQTDLTVDALGSRKASGFLRESRKVRLKAEALRLKNELPHQFESLYSLSMSSKMVPETTLKNLTIERQLLAVHYCRCSLHQDADI